MTNPDREELFTPDELAVRLDEWTNCLDKSQWDLRSDMRCAAIHLRRLASSDGGVKVRELEWHGPDLNDEYSAFGLEREYRIGRRRNQGRWLSGIGEYFQSVDAAKAAAQADYEARIKSALVEMPAVKGEPVAWPANLNPRTLDLVQRFALALAKKLRLAEEKYGHTDGWSRDDWEAECRDHLYQHLEKGDPRDVAAYCAFMWHHGWITYRPEPVASKRPVAFRVRQHRLSNHYELYTDEKDAQFWADDRGVDYEGLYLVADRYLASPADAGMREALQNAIGHIEHMAAWITLQNDWLNNGRPAPPPGAYSFEGLGEDMPGLKAALTAPSATTKSDGGLTPNATTITAIEELERGGGEIGLGYSDFQSCPSDPSPTRSERWVCAARQRGITLDPQDCDWPVCGCDPLANKVLDTIAESGFVIVPKDGTSMTDDQIKHMVDRFLGWTLPENFNPDGGVSFKRLENRHHHPDASPFYPMPVGTNLFDAVQATAMVRHMLDGLPSSTRSEVTVPCGLDRPSEAQCPNMKAGTSCSAISAPPAN